MKLWNFETFWNLYYVLHIGYISSIDYYIRQPFGKSETFQGIKYDLL